MRRREDAFRRGCGAAKRRKNAARGAACAHKNVATSAPTLRRSFNHGAHAGPRFERPAVRGAQPRCAPVERGPDVIVRPIGPRRECAPRARRRLSSRAAAPRRPPFSSPPPPPRRSRGESPAPPSLPVPRCARAAVEGERGGRRELGPIQRALRLVRTLCSHDRRASPTVMRREGTERPNARVGTLLRAPRDGETQATLGGEKCDDSVEERRGRQRAAGSQAGRESEGEEVESRACASIAGCATQAGGGRTGADRSSPGKR